MSRSSNKRRSGSLRTARRLGEITAGGRQAVSRDISQLIDTLIGNPQQPPA